MKTKKARSGRRKAVCAPLLDDADLPDIIPFQPRRTGSVTRICEVFVIDGAPHQLVVELWPDNNTFECNLVDLVSGCPCPKPSAEELRVMSDRYRGPEVRSPA